MKLISVLVFLVSSSLVTNVAVRSNLINPELHSRTPKGLEDSIKILTTGTWQVEKLHHVIFGKYSAYERGKYNTTGIEYDNLKFTFYADGTGSHIDQYKQKYSFIWNFTTNGLKLTINRHSDYWDIFSLSDKYLSSSVNLNIGGDTDNLESFRLVKPGIDTATNCNDQNGLFANH